MEDRAEGPYVDGVAEGSWVFRYASGSIEEGPMVAGMRHGPFVHRFPGSGTARGSYVEGKREGRWTIRTRNGRVREEFYRTTSSCGGSVPEPLRHPASTGSVG